MHENKLKFASITIDNKYFQLYIETGTICLLGQKKINSSKSGMIFFIIYEKYCVVYLDIFCCS